MSKKIENVTDLNCFSQLEFNNKNKESIHNKIKEYRKSMKSTYEDEQLFEEIMPTIQKQSQMNNIYQALIKNGLKYNTQIVRLIYRTITNISMRKIQKNFIDKKKEKKNPYSLPKIDMLKIQKEKYDNNEIKKIKLIKLNKEKLEEYKSKLRKRISIPLNTINESAKIKKRPKLYFQNFSSITNNSAKNLNNLENIDFNTNKEYNTTKQNNKNKYDIIFNKDLTLTPSNISMIEPSTNISNYLSKKMKRNNSNKTNIFYTESKKNNSFILSNKSKSFGIIKKCDQGVKQGNHNSKDLSKFKKDFDKSIHQKINSEDLLDLDHKVLEEKRRLIDKYTLLERNNIRRIKRELKEKISDNFAYENRKEFIELLKVDKNAHAYNLHLIEVDKINQEILKRINGERKKINKIKLMVDNELCRSIVINKKMDEINEKNRRINKYNSAKKVVFPEKFLVPKEKNFGLKGNLVPSLIHIRKREMKNMGSRNKKYLNKIY